MEKTVLWDSFKADLYKLFCNFHAIQHNDVDRCDGLYRTMSVFAGCVYSTLFSDDDPCQATLKAVPSQFLSTPDAPVLQEFEFICPWTEYAFEGRPASLSDREFLGKQFAFFMPRFVWAYLAIKKVIAEGDVKLRSLIRSIQNREKSLPVERRIGTNLKIEGEASISQLFAVGIGRPA